MKVSRNDPCPCGSGIKYKKCCGTRARTPVTSKHRTTTPENYAAMKTAWQHLQAGRLQQAGVIYMRVLETQPDNCEALNLCSYVASQSGRLDLARQLLEKSISINPRCADSHNNLGKILNDLRDPEKALEHLNIAIKLNKKNPSAYLNRANSKRVQGEIDEALADYRNALKLAPNNFEAHMNYIYTLNFSNRISDQDIFNEHCSFARLIEEECPTKEYKITAHNPDASGKIRIGYISPDFRTHSVAYFIEPILEQHNKDNFTIFCYHNNSIQDSTTDRIKHSCDHWKNIVGVEDKKLFDIIRKDGIDILVDLAGYTGNSRISIFARKPSPIQISWIGYPNTTGISAIDYKITDHTADPPGQSGALYTETLIRLPGGFLCYSPPSDSPPLAQPPFIKNGYITFGSFNNLAKTNEAVLNAWAAILSETVNSHILLKCSGLSGAETSKRIISFLGMRGISKDRVHLLGNDLSREKHLKRYAEIDIALDPFPYNGTTTTCEALWMGTPIVSLCGKIHRSRVGASILSQLDLEKLIGQSERQYIDIAVNLAKHTKEIEWLNDTLRDTMLGSSLCDAKSFTQKLEKAYKNIWEEWSQKNAKTT